MKKIKKFLIENKKILIAFILGLIISGTVGVVAYSVYANTITYDNTTSGITSTNVQDALDELYTKANTWINPNDMGMPQYYDFGKPTTSSPTTPPTGKNVYLGLYADNQYGVCINRNGTQNCFRYNNWIAEAKHVQEVFSEINCNTTQSYTGCTDSDFNCHTYSRGRVSCQKISDTNGENCYVEKDGTAGCGLNNNGSDN